MLQPTPPDSRSALTDDELLRRFVEKQDRAALAELVRRHGPLVFSVCRRVLGHLQDAEDAFQATFAVLTKSAARVRRRDSLSCWLHGVAWRISMKMLNQASRLKTESLIDRPDEEESPLEQIARRSDEEILDEELHRLPEQFRTVLILRYLESRTNQQIADQLRLSVTAVEAQLKRARGQLRQRLLRRGLTLATFAVVVTATQTALPVTAAAGELLIESTVVCSIHFSSGHVSSQLISHQLATMELASMTISTTKLLTVAGALLLTVTLGWLGVAGTARAEGDGPSAPELTTALPGGLTPPAAQLLAQNDPATAPAAAQPSTKQPAAIPSRSRQHSRAKLEEALTNETQIEFIDTPLLDAVAFLGDLHQITILLDTNALEEAGVAPDVPVNRVLSGVALQSVLNLILEPNGLDYVLKDEVLMITTRDQADALLETRVYWLDDLSVGAEGLAAILTETLEPTAWGDQGGPGSLKPISAVPKTPMSGAPLGGLGAHGFPTNSSAVAGKREGLVISQSQRMHRKIAELLEQLQEPAASGE